MLAKLFSLNFGRSNKCTHPLADADELRQVIAALPQGNDAKALGELNDWLQSLAEAGDFPPGQLLETVLQLGEAGEPFFRSLAQTHAGLVQVRGEEERRLWLLGHAFWETQVALYGRCLQAVQQSGQLARRLKARLPLLYLRTVMAVSQLLRWVQLHYGSLAREQWGVLARAVSAAEHAGSFAQSMNSHQQLAGVASVQKEFASLLACHAASPASLQPPEIVVAERLIMALGGHFAVGSRQEPTSLCWFDLLAPALPMRMAEAPAESSASLRFFRAGKAHNQLDAWLRQLERGESLPVDLALPAHLPVQIQLAALRHLMRQFAPKPEQRRHPRHPVDHRVGVVRGFQRAIAYLQGPSSALDEWTVENIGRGGMGLRLEHPQGGMPQVGEFLLALREGGDNWLPGVIRRIARRDTPALGVGVMTLGTDVALQEFRVLNKSGQATEAHCVGLVVTPAPSEEEILLALPLATFDVWHSLACDLDGRHRRLHPLAVTMRGTDYEIARYRVSDPA